MKTTEKIAVGIIGAIILLAIIAELLDPAPTDKAQNNEEPSDSEEPQSQTI